MVRVGRSVEDGKNLQVKHRKKSDQQKILTMQSGQTDITVAESKIPCWLVCSSVRYQYIYTHGTKYHPKKRKPPKFADN